MLAFAALAGQLRAADPGSPTSYTGTVVDGQGRPVAGATLDCYRYLSSSEWGRRGTEPELQQTMRTDGLGRFAVPGSSDNTLVVVKQPGFATAWKTWSSFFPDSSDPLVLSAPAALTGVVVDEQDQPVAGAEVWVADAIYGSEFDWVAQQNVLQGKSARDCFSARTGADGRFRIENFPANGQAGLAVSKPGLARRPIGKEFPGTRDCRPGDDLKLMVGPAGAVSGQIIAAETGRPVSGVSLTVDGAEAGLYSSMLRERVQSGADGTFHESDLQPGKYSVNVMPGWLLLDWVFVPEDHEVTVVAGETASNQVIHVTQGAMVEVSVVATNTPTPLADAMIVSGQSTGRTDSNGVARLRVPVGTNWFIARKDWRSENRTAVAVAGGTNQVRIELTPAPHITGTVRDLAGVPVAGARVSFHPGMSPSAPDYTEVTTDENGHYELILKLSRESFDWNSMIDPTNYVLARSLERNLVALQEFIELPAHLDLTLQPGITFSGVVQDTEGAPVTNALVDFRIEPWRMSGTVGPPAIKVDAQGSFSIPAMPQGRQYYFYDGITAKGYGIPLVNVKLEDTKTKHYAFPPFVLKRTDRTLAGQVVRADGKPAAGINVNFWGVGQLGGRQVKTDRQGRFNFDFVCAGDVTVSAYLDNDRGNVYAQGGDTNVVVRLGINQVVYGTNPVQPATKTTGIVRDPSGAPAAGVTVSLFPVQVRPLDTQTHTNGQFEFTWQGRATGEDNHWLLARDAGRNLSALQPLDQAASNLDLTLQPGLTLALQVQDTGGAPVTNATFNLSIWTEPNRGYGVSAQPLSMDAVGRYRLPGLPRGGRYNVTVSAPGRNSDRISIEAGETATELLELRPSVLDRTDAIVAGQVLGLDGQPAAGVMLTEFSIGQIGKETTTDREGRFSFSEVGHGRLSIVTRRLNGYVDSTSYTGSAQPMGGDTQVVIHLQPLTGAAATRGNIARPAVTVTTSGTVFDPAGAPAPAVFMTVLPSLARDRTVQSDAGGKYSLPWQSPFGRGTLFARDVDHNLAVVTDVEATNTDLNVHLQRGLTLTGAVRNSAGRPLTNAMVQVIYATRNSRISLFPPPPTNVNARGEFTLNALPQGAAYRVNVTAAGYGPALVLLSTNETRTRQVRLPVQVLKPLDRQVAGQVVDADGKPCWGCEVRATLPGGTDPIGGLVHTDANGHFVIKPVTAGTLDLRAMLPAGNNNPRFLVGLMQVAGGDTNIVVTLGWDNGKPITGPGGG